MKVSMVTNGTITLNAYDKTRFAILVDAQEEDPRITDFDAFKFFGDGVEAKNLELFLTPPSGSTGRYCALGLAA